MADILLDTFTGTGDLSTHIGETNATWSSSHSEYAVLSGTGFLYASTAIPASTGVNILAASAIVPGNSCFVEASIARVDASATNTFHFGLYAGGTITHASVRNFSGVSYLALYDSTSGASLIETAITMDLGVYYTFVLTIVPGLMTISQDGVDIISHSTADDITGATAFLGVYSNSVPVLNIDYVKVYTSPPVSTPVDFWTSLTGTTQI